VTCDDGYRDNLDAARIMRELGLPGVFFITTGFVGTDYISPWDRLAWVIKQTPPDRLLAIPPTDAVPGFSVIPGTVARRLRLAGQVLSGLPIPVREAVVDKVELVVGKSARRDRARAAVYMPWNEVREVAAMGHTIGAHTRTHAMLSGLDAEAQVAEMGGSRERIATEIGQPCNLFAYPFGKTVTFAERAMASARAAGFVAAFSFYGGYNGARVGNPYDIRRVSVSTEQSHALFVARNTFPALLARRD
jgi:peptidoglycan/xylan/chitin deacetylase (PgdA/CDA1 family)